MVIQHLKIDTQVTHRLTDCIYAFRNIYTHRHVHMHNSIYVTLKRRGHEFEKEREEHTWESWGQGRKGKGEIM